MSKQSELSYDCEDFGLSENELKLKYAFTGEHPVYSSDKWLREPYDYVCPRTYWEWVTENIIKDSNEYTSQ